MKGDDATDLEGNKRHKQNMMTKVTTGTSFCRLVPDKSTRVSKQKFQMKSNRIDEDEDEDDEVKGKENDSTKDEDMLKGETGVAIAGDDHGSDGGFGEDAASGWVECGW